MNLTFIQAGLLDLMMILILIGLGMFLGMMDARRRNRK